MVVGDAFDGSWKRPSGTGALGWTGRAEAAAGCGFACEAVGRSAVPLAWACARLEEGGKIAPDSTASDRMKCDLRFRNFFQKKGRKTVLSL